MSTFEQALHQSDATILAMFKTQQSTEALLSAIRVLQNADEYAITCQTSFDNLTVTFQETGVRVDIPTSMTVDTLGYSDYRDVSIGLLLTPKKDGFVITRLDGENFYNAYMTLKAYVAEAVNEGQVLEHIREYAEIATSLRERYDSAVWVANYNEPFFYVVNGTWTHERNQSFLMGLVDQTGKEVIPVEYDLIGTIGFDWPNIVEVKAGSWVGLYHLQQGEIVSPSFEWIAPYEEKNVFALVKTDSTFGWLDKSYTYHVGFPSEQAKHYINNRDYLPDNVEYSKNTVTLCEIPSEENYGSGYIIFPAYLTSTGIFDEVQGDMTMYTNEWRANTESIAVSHNLFDTVLDGVNMLLTSITKRYLDGREGFYTSNEISFLDNEGTVVGTPSNVMSTDITVTRIDSTLIEVKSSYASDGYEIYEDESDESETNIPQYIYFVMNEGEMVELTSNRYFNFTEFVKLDSSYLTGTFNYISNETMSYETRYFLSDSTLMRMRNEILASYGYIFSDPRTNEHFRYNNWYNPRFSSLTEIQGYLTDVDRHNLMFLEVILGPLKEEDDESA